jgi:carboxylate-amine ligase
LTGCEADAVLTVGVEEEFLLLEPSGAVAPAATDVLRDVPPDGPLKPELMAYQLETATRPCIRLSDLRAQLVGLRRLAADAAERSGLRLVAAGTPPYRSGALAEVTAQRRYSDIARRFPAVTAPARCTSACPIGISACRSWRGFGRGCRPCSR